MTEEKKGNREHNPHCPYCDIEITETNLPFCKQCKNTLIRCTKCLAVIPEGETVCHNCGLKVKTIKVN